MECITKDNGKWENLKVLESGLIKVLINIVWEYSEIANRQNKVLLLQLRQKN